MVTAEDMGNTPVEISTWGFMPSEYSQKTGSYYEFSLLMGYTDLDELTMKFDMNWSSSPGEVFSEPLLELIGVTGGEWVMFQLEEPFLYDGSSNLLYELSWDGPVNPPDSRIYSMSWEDDINSVLVAMSPDSATGYLSTVVPNILFLTAQDLEAQTFAGIKSSF